MKKRPLLWCFLLLAAGIFLYERSGGWERPPLSIENKSRILLYGTIEAIGNTEGSQKIYLSKVLIPSQSTDPGQVLVYCNQISNLKIGYQIEVRGEYQALQEASNPGQFDQKNYYEAQGIRFIVKDASVHVMRAQTDHFRQTLHEIRNYFQKIYQKIAEEEVAAVFSAMILGEKTLLSEEQEKAYQQGGISHILAISGLHISLVGMFLYRTIRKIKCGYGVSVLAAGCFMMCYGIMTGFTVSARRAVYMFLCYLGAEFFGERYDMLSAWALAGILILLKEPQQLFQCGFQLSFLSVGAIGVVYPSLRQLIKWRGKLWDSVCMGGSVTSVTLPCTLYWFFEFMPYGMLLNLLVIPMVPLVFLSGVAGGIAGGVHQMAGEMLAGPGVLILKVFDILISIAKGMPGNTWVLGRPGFWKILLYYVIFAAGLLLVKYRNTRKRKKLAVLCLGTALFLMTVQLPCGAEITFLDVGQGDCIYIRTPMGKHFLVDGGSTTVSEVGRYRILPFLKAKGIGKLEAVLLTHMDEDHISGVRELLSQNEMQIGRIYVSGIPPDETGTAMMELAKKSGVKIGYLTRGAYLAEKNFRMICLYPEKGGNGTDKNENSLVFLLNVYERKILLTGDLEGAGEEALLSLGNLTKVDVLKVAHHGSKNATNEKFLKEVQPEYSVISCGIGNRYGHPSREVLERLKNRKSCILCTMESGAITVKIYEKNMKIKEFLETKSGNP